MLRTQHKDNIEATRLDLPEHLWNTRPRLNDGKLRDYLQIKITQLV
jgi:hypothetical protein